MKLAAQRDIVKKEMKILIALFILIVPTLSFAGGSSFKMRIQEIEAKGNDEFRIVVEQLSKDHSDGAYKPRTKVIHLRHAPKEFKWGVPPMVTKEGYLKAINKLLQELKENEDCYFGVMGSGLIELKSNINEWQSNGLAILEEHGGKMVVYSFANSI